MEKMDGMSRDMALSGLQEKLFLLLKQQVKPEFLNRIDEIILFTPLSRTDLTKIVLIQFKRIQEMAARQRITLTITDSALEWIAQAGFDPAFGARPLKRVMQRKITNKLSELILSAEVQEDDTVAIDVVDGELKLTKKIV
jgi:ATP-dependent Clp protease ATP-binding subunit ClpA